MYESMVFIGRTNFCANLVLVLGSRMYWWTFSEVIAADTLIMKLTRWKLIIFGEIFGWLLYFTRSYYFSLAPGYFQLCFNFYSGQIEHRYKNGTIEIQFPNRSVRITSPYRERDEGIVEEWKYADGSNVIQMKNGERILLLPNGQKEIHSNNHKRREYPDGTVKIVFPDGSQETRYSNGRVRLKNKDGKLIMDSETISI